jgi:hypothetical protein
MQCGFGFAVMLAHLPAYATRVRLLCLLCHGSFLCAMHRRIVFAAAPVQLCCCIMSAQLLVNVMRVQWFAFALCTGIMRAGLVLD